MGRDLVADQSDVEVELKPTECVTGDRADLTGLRCQVVLRALRRQAEGEDVRLPGGEVQHPRSGTGDKHRGPGLLHAARGVVSGRLVRRGIADAHGLERLLDAADALGRGAEGLPEPGRIVLGGRTARAYSEVKPA